MRFSRFLGVVSFITCFSLVYVHQQTEIVRLAYAGQKNQAAVEELLDANTTLRYNIKKSASLVAIGSRISASNEFQMPQSFRTVRVSSGKAGMSLAQNPGNRETLISRIFGVRKAIAQGK